MFPYLAKLTNDKAAFYLKKKRLTTPRNNFRIKLQRTVGKTTSTLVHTLQRLFYREKDGTSGRKFSKEELYFERKSFEILVLSLHMEKIVAVYEGICFWKYGQKRDKSKSDACACITMPEPQVPWKIVRPEATIRRISN